MKLTGTDIGGATYRLGAPSEITIVKKALECANSMHAVLPHVFTEKELKTVQVYDNSNNLIFSGTVDEQSAEYSPDGMIQKIWARTAGAAMMDNEAVPASYVMPTTAQIFARHAQPYGMTNYVGTGVQHTGEFKVAVGDSEWDAIVKFCRRNYGYYPRVSGTAVDFTAPAPTNVLLFSNSSQTAGAIRFFRAAIKSKRQKVISEVLTRELGTENFTFSIPSVEAAARDIKRRRVMRYRDSSQTQKQQLAADYLDKARAGSSSVVLLLNGYRSFNLRTYASFEDAALGTRTGYAIAAVRYFADNFCERTEVELWPLADLL